MEFDYEGPLPNLRDVRLDDFFAQHQEAPLTVVSMDADDLGGVRIGLTDGYSFEIFPDVSDGGEHWRFFQMEPKSHHFVFTGEGIE